MGCKYLEYLSLLYENYGLHPQNWTKKFEMLFTINIE